MKILSLISIVVTLFVGAVILMEANEEADDGEKKNVQQHIIIDSDMTLHEAIEGTKAPKDLIEKLELINVYYYGYDNKLHQGQLVIHEDVKEDVVDMFKLIERIKFPVEKVIPIVKYNWSDNASMADNNTSAFNYRFVAGTKKLSNHAFGKAIDINPKDNPAVYADGSISPKGAKYNPKAKGTLVRGDKIVTEFKGRGWDWGGDWNSLKDYQHFDKE